MRHWRNSFILAAVVLLRLAAPFSNCEVVDGDLTFWTSEDSPAIHEAYYACGVALLYGTIPVADFGGPLCWFDGVSWCVSDAHWSYFWTDMGEGPDGKVWLSSFHDVYNGVAYLDDPDCLHLPDCNWWAYGTLCLDVVHWRDTSYLVFGNDVHGGAIYAEYCKPSCDDLNALGYFAGGLSVFSCSVSGEYLALGFSGQGLRRGNCLKITDLVNGKTWDFSDLGCHGKTPGSSGYFWTANATPGLTQIDAENERLLALNWASGMSVDSLQPDCWGLWLLARRECDGDILTGFWSFHSPELDQWRILPVQIGNWLSPPPVSGT